MGKNKQAAGSSIQERQRSCHKAPAGHIWQTGAIRSIFACVTLVISRLTHADGMAAEHHSVCAPDMYDSSLHVCFIE